MIEFTVELLATHKQFLAPGVGVLLHQAGVELVSYYETINTAPRILTDAQRRSLMDNYLRHCVLFERVAPGMYLPKHHLMVHLNQRTAFLGNPRVYHTYVDESLNGTLAKIARSSHRTTFSYTVLQKYKLLEAVKPSV